MEKENIGRMDALKRQFFSVFFLSEFESKRGEGLNEFEKAKALCLQVKQ